MNPAVVATVFALVAVAELPDKTMIATLVMGARGRPFLVWIGACLAFAVHVTLAVVAGGLLQLLPRRALEITVTVLFVAGAAYLLLVPEGREAANGAAAGTGTGAAGDARRFRVVATAFGVIFVGEFGDLTQLLTVNLAAHFHQPWAVFVGALAALIAVSALGAYGGRALLGVVPLALVRRLAGLVLLGLAAYSLYSLLP